MLHALSVRDQGSGSYFLAKRAGLAIDEGQNRFTFCAECESAGHACHVSRCSMACRSSLRSVRVHLHARVVPLKVCAQC